MAMGLASWTETFWAVATGARFGTFTVMPTVTVAESSFPSFAL